MIFPYLCITTFPVALHHGARGRDNVQVTYHNDSSNCCAKVEIYYHLSFAQIRLIKRDKTSYIIGNMLLRNFK